MIIKKEVHKCKKVRFHWLIWLLFVFLIMILCNGSSPVVGGRKTDSSVFFAIGRAMASGKVPYRDLFDHKGWYLYLFNYLGAMITSHSTAGLFIVEYIFMLVNALLFYRMAILIKGDRAGFLYADTAVAVGLLFTLNGITYQYGNFAETYGLTFQLISVFLILKYFGSSGKTHPPVYMLIHGICVAVMLGLRANLVVMWVPVGVLLIVYLLMEREFQNAILNIVAGIAGLLLGAMPELIYCAVTHSLEDMIQQSFLFNLSYANGGQSVLRKMTDMLLYRRTIWLIVLLAVSAFMVLKSTKVSVKFKILYIAGLLFSLYSVALSGRNYGHYYEYLLPFILPVVLVGSEKISRILSEKKIYFRYLAVIFWVFLTILCNISIPARLFLHTDSQKYAEATDELARLYKEKYSDLKNVLAVNNNATIYNKFDVLPQEKYFYIPAVSYKKFPEPIDSQAASILSGKNDVVILVYDNYKKKRIFQTSRYDKQIIEYLAEEYTMVCEKNHIQMYVKN